MIILRKNKQLIFLLFLATVFLINISISYSKYKQLVYEEVYETKAKIVNIYYKNSYDVLKLKTDDYVFFTSVSKDENISKLDDILIAFLTVKISYVDYLKGFYAKNIYFENLKKEPSFKNNLITSIANKHENFMISELFQALFLAVPISKELRDVCTNYGISHLIALSGFHLAVIIFLIYWIFYYPYKFLQTKYFPFRNRKYDLMLITFMFLFIYVVLTDFVPSLFRAFVMFCMGLVLLRSNIKLFSFENLLYVFLVIIALFPEFIFSLSLWFSIFGVFYILLFIQYFNNLKNKIVLAIFFNFWIYLAMNPVVHYFFATTSFEQLLSPFITMAFTVFYPFELFIHMFSFADFLDGLIELFLNKNITTYEVFTPLWFMILFLAISFLSIFYKKAFYILNFLLVVFTSVLYLI